MSGQHRHETMNRRTFLKAGSMGAVAAAGWSRANAEETAGDVQYRVLGRTGLKVSVVSLGAMRTFEPEVMQAAFDQGVNYIDTARCYKDGINERVVGMALKGYRDKVYLATKCHMVAPKADIIASVEESLRVMQTDYVDVLQLHHPSVTDMLHEDAMAALTQLREQGKVRFFGVTAHSDEVGILDGILADPDKFFDMALVTYNFKKKPGVGEAIQRAAKAGIGIIAMKTQAKTGYDTEELGDVSPHQAALKWALKNPGVHCAIPSMVNLDEVKEDTAVMRMDLKVTRRDRRILDRYDQATAATYCYRCGECTGTCPNGVDIPTVNRCVMYAEGYGDRALARAAHAALPRAVSAAACGDCEVCVARCVNGVALARQMHKAQGLFA